MNNWKDIAKAIDGVTETPNIQSKAIYQARKDLDKKIYFNCYERATKVTTTIFDQPIQGVLIDYCFKAEAWSEHFQCSLQTSEYFEKKQVVSIYCTDTQSDIYQDAKNFTGTADEAKGFIRKIAGRLSVNAIAILATEKGVIEVKTNAILFLAQFDFVKAHRTDYLVQFTPMLYNPETIKLNGKLPENYKTLEPDKYPVYADLSLTNINILAKVEQSHKLNEVCANVLEWKEWLSKTPLKGNSKFLANQIPTLPNPKPLPTEKPPMVQTPSFPSASPDDDLPF